MAYSLAGLWCWLRKYDALDIRSNFLDEDSGAWVFMWNYFWSPVNSLSCHPLGTKPPMGRISQSPHFTKQCPLICFGAFTQTLLPPSKKCSPKNVEYWNEHTSKYGKWKVNRSTYQVSFKKRTIFCSRQNSHPNWRIWTCNRWTLHIKWVPSLCEVSQPEMTWCSCKNNRLGRKAVGKWCHYK